MAGLYLMKTVWRSLRSGLAQVRPGLEVAALLRRATISADETEAALRSRLARREEQFLWMVEQMIFAHPTSPYLPLFNLAGYDLPRVRQLVMRRGLDAALDDLRAAGVFVRVQEFKGGEPVQRGGTTLQFKEDDFANPLSGSVLHARSSGSRGGGSETGISTEDMLEHARLFGWLHAGYGIRQRDIVLWATPGLGFQWTLPLSLIGRPPRRWFAPVPPLGRASLVVLRLARLAGGVPVPQPEVVPLDRAVEIVRFINRTNTNRGMICAAFPSAALRLVLAAEEAGIALGDVVFITMGEPVTPVKRRQIEDRGFPVIPVFGFSELGSLAWGCPAGRESDDLHVLIDRVAVRTYPRQVESPGEAVSAYLFTSLLPHARRVLLNVETGDYGGLEERRCGCFLERAGFRLHAHTIRSFEKLNAEGITFIGPSVIDLLEQVLPARFGGDSRHYQLVEGEDERGLTRLYLLVSPRLGPLDEDAVRAAVVRELSARHAHPDYGTRVVRQVWTDAETVQVVRREPVLTSGGKILHLHRDRGLFQNREGIS